MKITFNGNEQYIITDPFGAVDKWHVTPHTGIDLNMGCGTLLKSPVDGTIEKVFDYGNLNAGKGVVIDDGNGDHLIFGHMSDTGVVHVGEHVHTGQAIGFSGDTGHSTACHLHFGVRNDLGQYVNPSKYFGNHSGTMVAKTPDPSQFSHMAHDQLSSFLDTFSHLTINFVHWFIHLPILDVIQWFF